MQKKRIINGITFLLNQSWTPYLWLSLITILAAALRFYKLGTWSFWIDEIYTVNHATAHFSTLQLILEHLPPNRNWVPVSVILTSQAFNLWGVSELSARLTAAVIGILTVPILYFPVRKMFNTRVALIAVLLLAVSPWHLNWSQNARFYTSLMLFYSLALFTFYFAIEQDRPLYFIGFYLLFYLAMSERLIAVILIPVIFVYLLLLWFLPFEKPAGFNLRNILIFSAPILVFLLYEMFLFITTGDFIFASDLDLLAPPMDTPSRVLIIIGFNIGFPVLCLALVGGILLVVKKERVGLFFGISAVLPPLLIALANPFVFTVERYVFIALLCWLVLTAIAIDAIFRIKSKQSVMLALGVLLVLLVDAGGDNLLYYEINHGNRLDWREAVGYVRDRMENEEMVVSTRAPLVNFYFGENTLDFQSLRPVDFERFDVPIWFIVEYPGVWHGREDSKIWIEDHAKLLQFSYLRTMEQNFILIYHFDPAQNEGP